MSQHVALFALGVVLLAVGAGALACGAARLARRLGAGAFPVGLAAASLGGSAPVLALVVTAVLNDRHMLAVGTLVGSNVANVGLALGLAAAARPLAGSSRVVSAAIPVLLGATALFWFLGRDNELSRVSAAVLLVAFAGAVAYLGRVAKRETDAARAEFGGWAPNPKQMWAGVVLTAAGLAGLVGGALLVVPAAVEIANRELVIGTRIFGVTAVAFGASLPVVVAAVAAAYRGRADLALGVVVGASLGNLLLAAGVAGLVAPFGLTEAALGNEVPATAVLTLLLLAPLWNGLRVDRWEGALLLAAYAGFVAWRLRAAA